jgi:hypothetical protein
VIEAILRFLELRERCGEIDRRSDGGSGGDGGGRSDLPRYLNRIAAKEKPAAAGGVRVAAGLHRSCSSTAWMSSVRWAL